MKTYKQYISEKANISIHEEIVGRVQVHYDSINGYGKPIKVIATVPAMQDKAIDNKYELMRYLEKYIKDMKTKGVIRGKYEIVYPDDPKWRKSTKSGESK